MQSADSFEDAGTSSNPAEPTREVLPNPKLCGSNTNEEQDTFKALSIPAAEPGRVHVIPSHATGAKHSTCYNPEEPTRDVLPNPKLCDANTNEEQDTYTALSIPAAERGRVYVIPSHSTGAKHSATSWQDKSQVNFSSNLSARFRGIKNTERTSQTSKSQPNLGRMNAREKPCNVSPSSVSLPTQFSGGSPEVGLVSVTNGQTAEHISNIRVTRTPILTPMSRSYYSRPAMCSTSSRASNINLPVSSDSEEAGNLSCVGIGKSCLSQQVPTDSPNMKIGSVSPKALVEVDIHSFFKDHEYGEQGRPDISHTSLDWGTAMARPRSPPIVRITRAASPSRRDFVEVDIPPVPHIYRSGKVKSTTSSETDCSGHSLDESNAFLFNQRVISWDKNVTTSSYEAYFETAAPRGTLAPLQSGVALASASISCNALPQPTSDQDAASKIGCTHRSLTDCRYKQAPASVMPSLPDSVATATKHVKLPESTIRPLSSCSSDIEPVYASPWALKPKGSEYLLPCEGTTEECTLATDTTTIPQLLSESVTGSSAGMRYPRRSLDLEPSFILNQFEPHAYRQKYLQLQMNAPKPVKVRCTAPLSNRPPCYGSEFHGPISRDEAGSIMSQEGHYLIRESQRAANTYTLMMRIGQDLKNYHLYFDGHSHYVRDDKRFTRVEDLVADGLICVYMENLPTSVLGGMDGPGGGGGGRIGPSPQEESVYAESPYMMYRQDLIDRERKERMSQMQSMKKPPAGGAGSEPEGSLNQSFQWFNIMETEKPHRFRPATLKLNQSFCDVCLHFIWGLLLQGYECQDCGLKAHSRCYMTVPNDCMPSMKKLQRTFGLDLTTLLKATNRSVPLVVEKCIKEITSRGLHFEGIYRIAGNHDDVNAIKKSFDLDGDANISEEKYPDQNTITSVLKQFFSFLPISLVTFDVAPKLVHISNAPRNTRRDILRELGETLRELPAAHYQTLKYMIGHLYEVARYQHQNMMGPDNLAIVFTPTLMSTALTDNPAKAVTINETNRKVVERLIKYYDVIFSTSVKPSKK